MDKPLCRICDTRHYSHEAHKFPKTTTVEEPAYSGAIPPEVNEIPSVYSGPVSTPLDTIATAKAAPVKLASEIPDPGLAHVQKPDICPTCGHRLKPLTGAERQRRYREKHDGR